MSWFSKEKQVVLTPISGELKLVLDNTNDIILVLDDQKKVVHANKQVSETFNIPLEKIIDEKIDKLPFLDFSTERSKKFLESLESKNGSDFQEIDALDHYKNKVILEARVGRSDGHFIIVFKELSRPSDVSDVSTGLNFLSEVSIRLLELETEQDIYQFAGNQLVYLAKPACIFVNKQISEEDFVCVASAVSGDRFATGLKIVGNQVGNRYKASDKAKFTTRRGKIAKIAGGVYEISGGQIPKPVAMIAEAAAGVKSIFNIGFYWKGDMFGNASIITQKRSDKPQNSEIIETFANLVSVALQRRKAEDQLVATISDLDLEKNKVLEEKDKSDIILQSIGDGVFVINGEKKVLVFNKVAETLSGFSASKIIGKKWDELLSISIESVKKPAKSFVDKCLETGEVVRAGKNYILQTGDNKLVPIDATAAPLKDKKGKILGCVVIFRDVTKDRQVDLAKTEFVSLASHQLRTPLSAINWYVELLQNESNGKTNSKQKEYLDEVGKSSKRMVDLVNSLLNVSRLELGTFIVEPKPVELKSLISGSIKEMKLAIEKKKIKVSEKYQDIDKISLDEKLIRIVVQNLISNAIKYSNEGGEVEVELTSGDKIDPKYSKDDIIISVKDHGFGIPKSEQSQIFSKLFRATNAKVKEVEGTGLGLYMSKLIIEHSGGTIWFESEENKGSTFFVRLSKNGMVKKEGTKSLTQ